MTGKTASTIRADLAVWSMGLPARGLPKKQMVIPVITQVEHLLWAIRQRIALTG
jgi:hypothetical protein